MAVLFLTEDFFFFFTLEKGVVILLEPFVLQGAWGTRREDRVERACWCEL